MSVIETTGLTKRYGRLCAIEDISLTVEEGEVFGFLGPNGAGKTTTIRTLMGFLHPTAGSARVFGLDSQRDSVAIRRRVGNLPGDFTFDDAMTGRQIVRYFARLRGEPDVKHADELAERLSADLDRPLRELSRGNRQKIGLIQAMFHRPSLLMLDEPTSGLDPLIQEEFMELIDETRQAGRTVFVSSHNLPEIERICDRVGVIRSGRLIAVESIDELARKALHSVRITFEQPIDPAPFLALPGVHGLTSDGAKLAFTVERDLDAVIKLTATHNVVDFDCERPSLEDVFLTYYEQHEHRTTA